MKYLLALSVCIVIGLFSMNLIGDIHNDTAPIEIPSNVDEFGYSLDCEEPEHFYSIRTLPETNLIIVQSSLPNLETSRQLVTVDIVTETECTYTSYCCECNSMDQVVDKVLAEYESKVASQLLTTL